MSKIIRFYAGGKVRGTVWEAAQKHYLRNIRLWSVDVREFDDCFWPQGDLRGKRPKKKSDFFGPRDLMLSFDLGGAALSSGEMAKFLQQWTSQGQDLILCVGDSHGLSPQVKANAHYTWSLGEMTLCHLLARVMVLEQLYRAQQFLAGHPYSFV